MNNYEVIHLGSEIKCLQLTDNTVYDRVRQCNELISLIASKDRSFFKRNDNGNIADFAIANDLLLRYYDHYNEAEFINTSSPYFYEWKSDSCFNGGGTLQHIVMCLSNYIETGIPFLEYNMRLDNWGYSAESVNEIREFGLAQNIFTKKERYRFWSHNQLKEDDIIDSVLKKRKLDKDMCIIVRVGCNVEPKYIGEFNFRHICSIC